MNLDISKWKEFSVSDIFSVKYGVNLELNACVLADKDDSDVVNFVSRTADNNGVSARVKLIEGILPQKAGLISVAGGGSVLSAFYQKEPFYSGRDLYILDTKEILSKEVKLFLVTVIEKNRYKYNYGRQANRTLSSLKLSLPIKYNLDGTPFIDFTNKYSKEGYVPDWEFMEKYIKSLHCKPLTTKNCRKGFPLNVKEWKSFKIGNVFTMKNGKGITKKEIDENAGTFPAVQSSEENNGVLGKIDLEYCKQMNYTYSTRSCLTVARSGSAGFVAFQKDGCVVGDSAKILLLDEKVATIECYLFLQTILSANRIKYTYGRKVTEKKYLNDYIKLPVVHNSDGTIYIDETTSYSEKGYVPDWKFMKEYIKSLPYGDRI